MCIVKFNCLHQRDVYKWFKEPNSHIQNVNSIKTSMAEAAFQIFAGLFSNFRF